MSEKTDKLVKDIEKLKEMIDQFNLKGRPHVLYEKWVRGQIEKLKQYNEEQKRDTHDEWRDMNNDD